MQLLQTNHGERRERAHTMAEPKNEKKAVALAVERLHPFAGHPYKVLDNPDMDKLCESIRKQGVLSPLLVRPSESAPGDYEVISGHRRLHAAKRAGLQTVPAMICRVDRDEAAIALVDSNLHREHISFSEKAFAYKMKFEAMRRKGRRTDLTSSQVATRSDTAAEIGRFFHESRDQVFRYIRLTYLIPELLDLVDEKRIAFLSGVEISYLREQEQRDLLEVILSEDCKLFLSQAQQMKKFSKEGGLTKEVIFTILHKEKGGQNGTLRFKVEEIRGFFPKGYTEAEMYTAIIELMEAAYMRWQSKRFGSGVAR